VQIDNLKQETQKHRFEIDRLEQYSRRDSLRIIGMEESNGERTNDIVISLARDMGVDIHPNDISTSHRLPHGRRNQNTTDRPRPRAIIVKFVRRDTKGLIMRNKRKLKDSRRNVYVVDDLTPLRNKILRELKKRH